MVAGEDSRVPCTASRLNQSILKEINPQYTLKEGFKGDSAVKNLLPNVGAAGDLQELPHSLEEGIQPTPVLLPAEFHGQRNLLGYSPLGHRELDMNEHLPLHTLERLILKLKLQYIGHLMRRTDSIEKTLILGKI